MRINNETFSFLCGPLGPNVNKFDTPMIASNDVETRVLDILVRVATSNTLSMIEDLYGIAGNIALIIVRECCKTIKDQLLSIVIEK